MDDHEHRPLPEPVRAGELDWRALFEGSSPRDILRRLVDGDPLGLRARCEQRIRLQALLLDVDRLSLRATAHVARHSLAYRGTPPLDVWVAERIRKSLTELLDEDDERSSARAIPTAPRDERLLAIADALGLEPELFARGVATFNRAPFTVRSALCGMLLDGTSPAKWTVANGGTVDSAIASFRRALWILGVREDMDVEDLLADPEAGGDDAA